MVPNVEEVRSKAEILSFCEPKMLDQREIPVLLERPTINVAVERAELGSAGRTSRVRGTTSGIGRRSRHKIIDVDVLVETIVNVARG